MVINQICYLKSKIIFQSLFYFRKRLLVHILFFVAADALQYYFGIYIIIKISILNIVRQKMNNPRMGYDQPYVQGADIILKIVQNQKNKPTQQPNSQTKFNINSLIQPNNLNNSLGKSKQNMVQGISKNLLEERQFKSIVSELDLKVNFQNRNDCHQLKKILFDILKYPSSQLAKLHSQANRLGNFDLPQQRQRQYKLFDQQQSQDKQYCPCCGFIKQEDQLKICTQNLEDVQNIGISTYLYFRSVLNIIILLIAMFLVYGIYSIATNIVAAKDNPSIENENYLILSMGSKQLNSTDKNQKLIFFQAWIGFVMIIIWGFLFYYLQRVQRLKQDEVSRQSITAADFSVLIQNLPVQMDQESLQRQLDQFCKSFQGRTLKITAYNEGRPFYLNETQIYNERVKQILDQEAKLREKIVHLLLQRQQFQNFQTPKQQRQKMFFDYRRNQQNKKNEYQRAIAQIQSKLNQKHVLSTTTAFVSFQTNKQKQFLTQGSSDRFYKRIKQFIPCFQNQEKFFIKLKRQKAFEEGSSQVEQHKVSIQRAPQPEDVQWANIGITNCELIYKKSVTYTITALMLGASFIIVYGLSLVQIKNSYSRYLSFFISFVISLINIIISQVIRKLCLYERNLTKTRYQTSLALKSIFAQLINSILIPIMTNRFIKDNIYQPNGLVDDIFLLGITNAFLCPILKIFDTYYYYVRFMAWYTNRAAYKLKLKQSQLNEYTSLIQFEVGYQYIYIINLFLFTCFFVSLQPIICVFSIFGLVLMFWAQKYSLFSRCRRPVPGTNILHAYLTQLIYLGGISYSLGSLMWSNFLPQGIPKNALIPNLFASIGGVIIMLIPYRLVSQLYNQEQNQEILSYQQNKKFLPSEYDRLNPVTSHQAIEKFRKFMMNEKEKLKYASTQVKNNVLKLFQKQGRHNHQYGYQGSNNMLKGDLLNILPMQNNSINPQFAANFLFGGQQNKNIPALKQMLNFGSQINLQSKNQLFKGQNNKQIADVLFGNLGAQDNNQNHYQYRNEDQFSGNQLVSMFEKGKLNKQMGFNE